jgi:hypothetical protein
MSLLQKGLLPQNVFEFLSCFSCLSWFKKVFAVESHMSTNKKIWRLTFTSSEAAVNLYSILLVFQQTKGSGIINREAVKCITQWLRNISRQIPNIDKLANDSHGPFR